MNTVVFPVFTPILYILIMHIKGDFSINFIYPVCLNIEPETLITQRCWSEIGER
jgi:hypothetical protein